MPPSIGLQLYTLRASLVHDLAGGLRRVAEIGYQGVETAFFDPRVSVADTARLLRELGLTVFATHAPLPVGDGQEETLRLADILGCRRVIWHGWPAAPTAAFRRPPRRFGGASDATGGSFSTISPLPAPDSQWSSSSSTEVTPAARASV